MKSNNFHLLLAFNTATLSPHPTPAAVCWLPLVQNTGLTGVEKHFNFTGNVAKIIVMT